jgi:ketosteroid isomerase-like protein
VVRGARRRRDDPAVAADRLSGEDRQALADLIATYALACDRRDVAAVVACFSPDGVFQYNDGAAQVKGADALADFYRSALLEPGKASDSSTHLMGNILLDVDGDGARGEVGAIAVHVYSGADPGAADRGDRTVLRGLEYTDTYVRRAGGWLIAHRHHRATWQSDLSGLVITTPAG